MSDPLLPDGRISQFTTIRQMRESGASVLEIARELGISASRARYYADPSYAERSREQSRLAKQRRRTPCPRCGALRSWDRSGTTLCASCRNAELELIPCPSRAAYERGCRCDGCKKAFRDYARERWHRLHPGARYYKKVADGS